MEKNILVTIIIATFNSEKTLPKVLRGIRNQKISKNKVEVLLIDGGSTDKTKTIGESFGYTVINNPRTEPVYAKFLGFLQAKGKYIVYLDHDEVLDSQNSIQLKINVMAERFDVKAVIGSGYINPKDMSFVNDYINEFGDPFSFFIYRLSKDIRFFYKQMTKRYEVVYDSTDYTVFSMQNVSDPPIIELCAAASMIDAHYMKKKFAQTKEKPELIPHFFYLLIQKNPYIAITKHDGLVHYSSETFIRYINKIKWRVKNNIFNLSKLGDSGFSGRKRFSHNAIDIKKYLFLIYAFLLVFPLIDAIYLIVTRKKIAYYIHLPLTLYTAIIIVWYYLLKILGYKPVLRSYDEKKIIDSKL